MTLNDLAGLIELSAILVQPDVCMMLLSELTMKMGLNCQRQKCGP